MKAGQFNQCLSLVTRFLFGPDLLDHPDVPQVRYQASERDEGAVEGKHQ